MLTDGPWINEDKPCEFFCVRRTNPQDPEDQGSDFPDPECRTHWAAEWCAVREVQQARRMERWWITKQEGTNHDRGVRNAGP